MDDHQRRLWRRMIALIDDFRADRVSFPDVVGGLEGALDAGGFRDESMLATWYDLWQELEIRRALKADAVSQDEVAEDIEAMRAFLVTEMEKASSDRFGDG